MNGACIGSNDAISVVTLYRFWNLKPSQVMEDWNLTSDGNLKLIF